ncbi:MAG TPA: YggS family pyridoxal phosphate-dependent enzyme [Tissierellaceae bacterium]
MLEVQEKINNALIRSGREGDKVKLIAVTKTVDIDRISEAIEEGIEDIGENRTKELVDKHNVLGNKVNFHMIGHLQTNKVKDIIGKTVLIHSLDRIALAEELDKRSKKNNLITDVLIQVNIAEEESKFGLKTGEVLPFIEDIMKFENIRVRGLMTIAPYTDDKILLRKVFRTLYNLREDIKNRKYEGIYMDYLSMGMSNDYEIAIEEGSNMVRIGTAIFGKRNYYK